MQIFRSDAPRFNPALRKRMSGFTLIQLIVVVTILAVLATLIVPKIDNPFRQAQTLVEADTQAQIANYLTLYYTKHQFWPDQFDSLLDSTGTAGYTYAN